MYDSNENTEFDIEIEVQDADKLFDGELAEDAWDWANSDEQIPW